MYRQQSSKTGMIAVIAGWSQGVALCIEALGLPGASFARGYIQAWATSDDLTDEVASRIMSAADAILQAGYEPPSS